MTHITNVKKNNPLVKDSEYASQKSKLGNAGYHSPRIIAASGLTDIVEKLGVDLEQASQINSWAVRKIEKTGEHPPSFSSADLFYNRVKNPDKLPTGSNELNEILGGGIEFGAITHIYGPSGVGKTQFCYNLCLEVQRSVNEKETGAKAIYIDTENKFTPNRIIEITKTRGLKIKDILQNIMIVKTINSTQLENTLQKIPGLIEKDSKIKLVIVDSMINHYRHEYDGLQKLSERQGRLGKNIGLLQRTCQLYGVAVVITNQVSSNSSSYSADKHIPTGGNVLIQSSKHLIYFNNSGRNFLAKIINSTSLPRGEARFAIGNSGIKDPMMANSNRQTF